MKTLLIAMLALLSAAVFTGCRASGEVGDTATQIPAVR